MSEDSWRPANPGDTPGELVPGEGDTVEDPYAGRPMARCVGHDRRVVIEVPGRLSLGGFYACLDCDMIPPGGHPHHEPGWSRRQAE